MDHAILDPDRLWTEEDFLALGETPERLELFDGKILVSPSPTRRHQHIARKLTNALEAALPAGFGVDEAFDVRLRSGRVFAPDVVLTANADFDKPMEDSDSVLLVCEVISPANGRSDKVIKMRCYAEAGIPWYLLAEQTGDLALYRLEGKHYVQHAVALYGETLHLTDPIDVVLDTRELGPPK